MKKTFWFVFNEDGEIISKEFETEKEAEQAMNEKHYDDGETAAYVDGIELEENN
jgi:hypothetical protein